MKFPDNQPGVKVVERGPDGGMFIVDGNKIVIASDGLGWDHVSISLRKRCPTWSEMSRIKNLFWDEEETVVQFHPKKSKYRNVHPYCLHLWKKQGTEYELPPTLMIG